ncbi:MAG: GTP cyclohydrolase I, partial [Pseudomonadota bacterium]
AVMIASEHQCMSTRGVHKHGVDTVTTHFSGVFKDDPRMEERFLRLIKK